MRQNCPGCDQSTDSPVLYIPSRLRLCPDCAYDAHLHGDAPILARRGYLSLVT